MSYMFVNLQVQQKVGFDSIVRIEIKCWTLLVAVIAFPFIYYPIWWCVQQIDT